VSHMNADHADAIALYATKLLGAACSAHVSDMNGAWRMSGIDPEGCDLVLGARALRLPFGSRIATAAEARAELVRLVGVARAG
jgi:heme oxygenase (biliverdin-IX-beta and delta-forming)